MPRGKPRARCDGRRVVVLREAVARFRVRDARPGRDQVRVTLEVGSRWFVRSRRGAFPDLFYDLEEAAITSSSPRGLLNVPASWIRAEKLPVEQAP